MGIQSQKHQVAEELRKKFRHYIAQATPMADQFMGLFDKMFKEKLELLKLSRPHGVAPDISQVPLEMADVVRQIERYDLDIDSAHTFMNSERFRSNFFLMGEKLFRLGGTGFSLSAPGSRSTRDLLNVPSSGGA